MKLRNNILRSYLFYLNGITAISTMVITFWSCEKETSENSEIITMDTLDYTEVIRTTDNFFGVSDLYFDEGHYFSFIDTCMNITSNRVLYFTGPKVPKTATIQIKIRIPVPYDFPQPYRIEASGECIIKADKGHYLFKGGNYSEITSSEGDKIITDTTKMNKIITGQTIRISPSYLSLNNNSYLYLETSEILNANVETHKDYYGPIGRAIDLFKENATVLSMKVIDDANKERDISSCDEIDYDNDSLIVIEATYRSNFANPVAVVGLDTRYSVWERPGEPMILIIGK